MPSITMAPGKSCSPAVKYNPVKHGHVKRPEDYGHSSFQEYVKRGWYEIGWGHVEPPELKGLEFE